MKTKLALEKDILNVIMKIHNEFPELSKYIAEMPDDFVGSNHPIDIKNFKEFYNSLDSLVLEYAKTHEPKKMNKNIGVLELTGYPYYPKSEDIYMQAKELKNINPEDLSRNKTPNELPRTKNEKSFQDDVSGADLDVPGSEFDDEQENIGSEDEENNYYSLGGDNHNELDEDNG